MNKIKLFNTSKLLDFSDTHKVLLFRCINILSNNANSENLYENIDLLFQTVKYMDITTTLEKPLIRICEEKEYSNYINSIGLSETSYKTYKLYLLETEIRNFHVIASHLEIIKNHLPAQETNKYWYKKGFILYKRSVI